MRVLSSLSESEIKNVLKIRNGDPILPNEPTLVDLMISPIRSIGCNFQSERPCSWPTSDTDFQGLYRSRTLYLPTA
jgi:hypothetical protein